MIVDARQAAIAHGLTVYWIAGSFISSFSAKLARLPNNRGAIAADYLSRIPRSD